MIYVPDKDSYNCVVVYNSDVIRAYRQTPSANTTISYRDYYVNSNYMFNDGTQTFSNYSTMPHCLSSDVLTDDVYYRNDFDSILVIFLIMCIFCFYIPLKIFSKLFRKGGL